MNPDRRFQEYCGTKAIVFDLDGTLIDTMKYFGEVASEVINKYYDIPIEKAREMYFETSGVPFFQQLEMMFPDDERNSKAAEEYEKNKLSFFFNEPFSPVLRDILSNAKKEYPEFIFVVSSNNFENLVREYMKKYNVDVFDEILGFREGFSKGKDHFSFISELYGLKEEEIVFIGDSWWDAKMALDNNIPFMGISTTFTLKEWVEKYPDITVIEDFKELFDFLEVIRKCRQ